MALLIAAFSKGRVKEAATDFVCVFGILGAVFGTIGVGQNYNAYPLLVVGMFVVYIALFYAVAALCVRRKS